MKKIITKLGLFLSFAVVLISCSIDRNAVTRRGDAGIGIGSAVSVATKTKITPLKENSLVAEGILKNSISVIDKSEPNVRLNDGGVSHEITQENKCTLKLFNAKGDKNIILKKSVQNMAEKGVKKTLVAKPGNDAPAKNWIIALLLCIFLGVFGLHRFYLGYDWQGIIQLLTLGGFFIWSFIDLIRIIIRDLQPKYGPYDDDFDHFEG